MPSQALTEALVEPWDGPLRFLVHSQSRDGVRHGVDLAGHLNNGFCACEHFQFQLGPRLKAGEPGWHRCKHIDMAREFFAQRVIEIVAATHRNPHPDNWDRDPEIDSTPNPEQNQTL